MREYLEKLEWDRVPRIETWLTDVLGVNASEYSAKVGKRWLISAVARVMRPGCKADSVMILEGGQGAGKSTAMGVLGGEWFMDTPFALGDKDSFQAIRGKWIVELGSWTVSTRPKAPRPSSSSPRPPTPIAKATAAERMTCHASVFSWAPPTKRNTSRTPRQPSLLAGVLQQGRPGATARDPRPAVAEALFCFEAGDVWWVNKDESKMFAEAQDERFVVDEWEGPILAWMEESQIGETATGNEILTQALKLDFGHWGKPEQMRVGAIMHRLGWRKRRMPALPKSGVRPMGLRETCGLGPHVCVAAVGDRGALL